MSKINDGGPAFPVNARYKEVRRYSGDGETLIQTEDHRPKQKYLPGMEPPSIPKIDKLADAYVEARNERMSCLTVEIAKRDLLEAGLKEADLKHYEYDGKTVDLVEVEKVLVRTKKEEPEESE